MPTNGAAPAYVTAEQLKLTPALASIEAACRYMGGISRSKFYADILPLLETAKFGNRTLVVVASMDRLIASRSKAHGKISTDIADTLASSPEMLEG